MKQIRNLLLGVILILVLVTTSYSQVPPTLILPGNLNNCVAKNTYFEWTEVPNAISYIFEVADNPGFVNSIATVEGLTETNITVEMPNWDSDYYWRATSVFPGNNFGVAEAYRFKTRLEPLDLLFPDTGDLCIDMEVTLRWHKADAEFYTLQVSESPNFDTMIVNMNNIVDTTYTLQLPRYSTTYYWRVAHKKATCQSDFSEVWQFVSKLAPPVLMLPVNNAFGGNIFNNNQFDVELIWHHLGLDARYDVQISSNLNFSDTLFQTIEIQDTTFAVTMPDSFNVEYFWRVRVWLDNCLSYWSEPFSFKTPYGPAILTIPANLATCVTMQNTLFDWGGEAGASRYRIQISDTATFTNILIDTNGISNTEIGLNLSMPLKVHYWRVRGEDNNNIGLWSEISSFITTLSPPQIISPVANASGLLKNIHFKWQNYGTTALYDLLVYQEITPGNNIVILDTAGLDVSEFNFTVSNDNTRYFWQVRAIANGCVGDWTELNSFRTLIPSPELLSPENLAAKVSLFPIFEWKAVVDAESYDIDVSKVENFTTIYQSDRSVNSLIWSKAGVQFDASTQYFWRVRARNQDGVSLWSETFTFTTQEMPAEAPVLVEPANNSTKEPLDITFIWEASEGAVSYILTVATDPQFEDIFVTQETDTTELEVIGLERFTNYWWKVQAIGVEGVGFTSVVYTFRTKDIAPDNSVALISPEDNETNLALIVNFKWNSVDRALAYVLQVADNQNFAESSIVQEHASVKDTTRTVSSLDYDKTYYWRVAAWNEDGQAGWSVVRQFKTITNTSVFSSDNNINSHIAFPNPASDIVNIKINAVSATNGNLRIMNLLGNEMLRLENIDINSGENMLSVDVSDFPIGVFIYSFETNIGTSSGRIIRK